MSTRKTSGRTTEGGDKGTRLVNPKDTTIKKLEESFTHADFTNWVEELYMHIEGTTGWSHSTPLLKMVRKEKAPITEESLIIMLNNIHDDRSNDFDARDFDTKARGQELYKYLFPRLNNKLKGLVSNTKDGFEVLRRVVREHDPVTDNTKVALRARFTQLAGNRCANLNATRNLVQEIDKKLAEYLEKTGEEMPAELQSTVLHGAMDDDIARDAVLARVGMSNYTKIKSYVEEMYLEQQERKIDVGTKKDKALDSFDNGEEEWPGDEKSFERR